MPRARAPCPKPKISPNVKEVRGKVIQVLSAPTPYPRSSPIPKRVDKRVGALRNSQSHSVYKAIIVAVKLPTTSPASPLITQLKAPPKIRIAGIMVKYNCLGDAKLLSNTPTGTGAPVRMTFCGVVPILFHGKNQICCLVKSCHLRKSTQQHFALKRSPPPFPGTPASCRGSLERREYRHF